MLAWNQSSEFWALPEAERIKLFQTPSTSGGWECPECDRLYRYHSGAPTTGQYAFFHGPDANDLFYGNGCCSVHYRDERGFIMLDISGVTS